MRQHPLVGKVASFLQRCSWQPADTVVAVSGGPDSMALLRVLLEARSQAAAPRLIIAHVNHQLRGAESDADEAFVVGQCQRLQAAGWGNLECRSTRVDARAAARKERANLESTARRLRYDWLAGLAQECRAPWVATGHSADDQAETVLHRLVRGAGIRGLRGIAARRVLAAEVNVIRPLLAVTRAEVLAYLRDREQPFREDSSNRDLHFTRNRIRQDLLPLLADQYNPAIRAILCRLAVQAEETYAGLEARAAVVWAAAEKPRVGQVLIFDLHPLRTQPRYLIREIFRLVWQREGWPTAAMSFARWDDLAALVFGELAAVDLPHGLHAETQRHVLRLRQRAAEQPNS
ncbi:MAG: tRNA lysidine(34) synthetase TilS [Gemmataceae bacterium]